VANDLRRVALLGATGSIGQQTLDVLRRERDRFALVALAAGERVDELIAIAKEFGVAQIGVTTQEHAIYVERELGYTAQVVVGSEGLEFLAKSADIVVNAIVGFAGLPVTLATLKAGGRLALANKESLVAAAPLVEAVRGVGGSEIVPIDSEHCAIHQCLAGASTEAGHPDVRRLLLTASGGPFRGWSLDDVKRVTKKEALSHPTWSMGPKITIDSSTLMNKGLEVLEAAALFQLDVSRIDIVVHPQSIVHSMVEYVDGATLAQLSNPDMRLPIAYALGLPERLDHAWGRLRFDEAVTLEFEPPDREVFRLLDVAYEAGRRGGAAPAWLSAANEVAVDAFLNDTITWCDIATVVAKTMDHYADDELASVEALYENDATARHCARKIIGDL
jgi:1-deoxy-D-xylulose-5-phosphate reductoisomerase